MSNDIISKTDSINQSASNTLKNIYAPIIENHIYHNVLICKNISNTIMVNILYIFLHAFFFFMYNFDKSQLTLYIISLIILTIHQLIFTVYGMTGNYRSQITKDIILTKIKYFVSKLEFEINKTNNDASNILELYNSGGEQLVKEIYKYDLNKIEKLYLNYNYSNSIVIKYIDKV